MNTKTLLTSSAGIISRFPTDLNLCISSLQSCAHQKNLPKGKEIHLWMLKNGFLSSPHSITSLINMYSKCNRPNDAFSIFNTTHDRNLFAWNSIISGFVSNGLPEKAFDFYEKLRLDNNLIPDKFTFPCVIKACTVFSEMFRVRKIHGELLKFGLGNDGFIVSALINFYLKFKFMVEAQQLFERLTERDVVLWNAMINGYAQIGEFDMALEVFGRMVREEGLVPSKFTVTGILSVFATKEYVNNGRSIHGFVKKVGYESDVVVSNSLIDMYGKCKVVQDAHEIFDKMPERDLFSWNSIISVYEQSANYEETLKLFYRMREAGFQPDVVTITAVLPACSHTAALVHGREIHGYMIVNGLNKDGLSSNLVNDVYVENAVMDMYTKCGSLIEAELVFEKMKERDVASWNIMIRGYGLHGQVDEALNMFSQMLKENVKPDEVTFVGILSACSHGGLVSTGREILSRMELDHGVLPTVEHYACAVDMLGRAGFLEEACKLAKEKKVRANSVVWRALLAACKVHGNHEMAELAAKQVFELEPEHCGSHVLISNIYGAVGKHQEVSEVRENMRVKNVKKSPGCSWIELKSGLHVFVSGDRSHPETDGIYSALDGLIGRLRECGYMPDFGNG